MNKNLIVHELRQNLKVFLIVTIANTGFLLLTLLMYSGMKESLMSITEMYASMPESFAEALNLSAEQWSHILGFYASYVVYYGPLFLGMYAIYLGGVILSKEEHKKTADFLLAKPLTRSEIILSKGMVVLIYVTAANMILWINGILWCGADSGFSDTFLQITTLHLYILMICYFFGAMGLLLSLLTKRARSLTGPGIGIVFGFYMMDIVLRITDKAAFLLYLTPFKYMNIDLMQDDYRMEWWRLLITGGTAVILLLLSVRIYQKKNILI